jgi:hypothetical protein
MGPPVKIDHPDVSIAFIGNLSLPCLRYGAGKQQENNKKSRHELFHKTPPFPGAGIKDRTLLFNLPTSLAEKCPQSNNILPNFLLSMVFLSPKRSCASHRDKKFIIWRWICPFQYITKKPAQRL